MKVCVYGLGAMGGMIAGRLSRGGAEVCAVARGATLAGVRERGLRLIERAADGRITESSFPIEVSDDPARLPQPDLVILTVKATALPEVADGVRRLLTPGTVVLSALNGIQWWFFSGLPGEAGRLRPRSADPTGALAASIPVEQVLGGVLHLSAACPEPGTVACGPGERIILGDPAGGPPDERVTRVADVLARGGFQAEISERIQRDVWFKLWGNLTMNPLSAVTGATLDRVLDDPLVRDFASRCMREAAEIGARIGLPIDVDPEERHAVTRRLGAAKTSMLQDVENGRPVEIDALVTVVKEIAELVGVATPNIDALLGVTRLHARVRGLYPDQG